MNRLFFTLLLSFFVGISCQTNEQPTAYLFTYFNGNGPGEEAIHYAISTNGYDYLTLNDNRPILDNNSISSTGGVRDPHLLRGADGKTFYMVATDLYVPEMGWKNYAMILLKSNDLIHWESSVVNIPEAFPEEFGDVWRVWAPQSIYDPETGKYMIYFSMKQNEDPDKIYYAFANKDFTGLESAPKQLYFPPEESNNKACIDGDIIYKDGVYHLFHKAEDGDPGIKLATSASLTEGYKLVSNDRVDSETDRVEGSSIFKLNDSDEWILMYDIYTQGRYQFTKSSDLKNFKIIDEEISMNFRPRHGSILPITETELKKLINEWNGIKDPLIDANAEVLKKQNVAVNSAKRQIRLPVKRGTDLSNFNPEFATLPGMKMSPKGAQDFSQGAVTYTISMENGGSETYEVIASEDHNPVLEGFYADPEILYAEKTGKYYIYPTTDGFYQWGGYYFKAFSSENLVDWQDEGTILDLTTNVTWTNRNAWAPCMIEKKIDGAYKYFFYFTAAQNIGVAYSDNPAGPFTDKGEVLIDWKPEGINWGQEIDPDVFTDPQSGKSYLYWGNGYLAAAELNKDMLSIKKETLTILTPDNTYREGTYVFFRNGKYYFMWSEDDTRSPNYKVRYAFADSPLGPLSIPENNIVITQDLEQEIFATGHNSVLQIPGKDEWYLVYHRFTYPDGVKMGRFGGFHREVCIDKLEFDENGAVIQVKPTLKGIKEIGI